LSWFSSRNGTETDQTESIAEGGVVNEVRRVKNKKRTKEQLSIVLLGVPPYLGALCD
jgi:hypothetical protein